MPDPVSPLLDDFDRANEDPLSGGGNWALVDNVYQPMRLLNNEATRRVNSNSFSYWTPQSFDGDCEVWGQKNDPGFSTIEFIRCGLLRDLGGTGAFDGYQLIGGYGGHGYWLRRYTNGGFVDLAAPTPGGGIPAYIMLKRNGNDVEAWYSYTNAPGSWLLAVAVTDTTYMTGLHPAIGSTSNIVSSAAMPAWLWVGGGIEVPAAPTVSMNWRSSQRHGVATRALHNVSDQP